ncbi:MAG: hypothetical protein ACI9Z3_001997 [Roseivirga sp.]|jgi:hypothetical protein
MIVELRITIRFNRHSENSTKMIIDVELKEFVYEGYSSCEPSINKNLILLSL